MTELETLKAKLAQTERELADVRSTLDPLLQDFWHAELSRKTNAELYERTLRERDEARAACAEKDAVLRDISQTRFGFFRNDIPHALSLDCGRGWTSPEERERIIKERDGKIQKLREALSHYAECSDGCTCGDGWDHEIAKQALESTQ